MAYRDRTMYGLTPGHLILVLLIVLIVFGPGKLPEVGAAIGRGLREFRKATSEVEAGVRGNSDNHTT